LELCFGAVRSAGGVNNTAGGVNNNPTVQQFTAAYKRLMMRCSIKGINGNATAQDPAAILCCYDDTVHSR